MTCRVRLARHDEIEICRDIERVAAAKFRGTVHAHVANEAPGTPADMEACRSAGLLFVAVDEADRPLGFLACAEMDEGLYIGELDVDPKWQDRGSINDVFLAHEAESGLDPASRCAMRKRLD